MVPFLNMLGVRCHRQSRAAGFWEEEDRNVGEMIALMHSELSELLEANREGNPPSEKIPDFSSEEEELADAVIRILDYATAKGYDMDRAVIAKLNYNQSRPHKHGKEY